MPSERDGPKRSDLLGAAKPVSRLSSEADEIRLAGRAKRLEKTQLSYPSRTGEVVGTIIAFLGFLAMMGFILWGVVDAVLKIKRGI